MTFDLRGDLHSNKFVSEKNIENVISFSSAVIVGTHRRTETGPIALPGPLNCRSRGESYGEYC